VSVRDTWEGAVREACASVERPAGSPAPTTGAVVSAELGRRLERAHELAVGEAEQLAQEVTLLARRLGEEGIGATFAGHDFLGQAQRLREALVVLDTTRSAFATARRIQERETKGGEGA
jgi:hypothetical protein